MRWTPRAASQPAPTKAHPFEVGDPFLWPRVATWPSDRNRYGLRRCPAWTALTSAASRRACRMACWLVGGSTCPGVAALGTAAQSPRAQTRWPSTCSVGPDANPAPFVQGKAEVGDDRVSLDSRVHPAIRCRTLPRRLASPYRDDLFQPRAEPQVHARCWSRSVTYCRGLTGSQRGSWARHRPVPTAVPRREGRVIAQGILGEIGGARPEPPRRRPPPTIRMLGPAPALGVRFDAAAARSRSS